MVAKMEGVFSHVKSENLDTYLEKTGVPWIARKVISNTSPTVEISKNGEEWQMDMKTAVKNNTVKFILGKEFEEKSPFSDNPAKGLAVIEDDCLVFKMQTDFGTMKRTLSFTDEGLTITMLNETKRVTATRLFKREK